MKRLHVRSLLPVKSSQIKAIGYDAIAMQLVVEFRTKTKRSVYSYASVPEQVAADLVHAPSIGSFFGANIKCFPNLYPYLRIEDEDVLDALTFDENPAWLEDLEPFRTKEEAAR